MAFKLRTYQNALVNKIYGAWQRVRVVLAVLATGGGKTAIFSWIIQQHNGASAAVVHRKEIVSQISLSLAALGVRHRLIAPQSVIRRIRRRHFRFLGESFVDQHALCGVVSVQTLTSKGTDRNKDIQAWVKQVTLCVFDEGHHYVNTGSWAKAVDLMERAKLLLVTATPKRADGKGMGTEELGGSGYVEEMVEGPTTKWLMEQGYLSRYKYFAPESDLNVKDIALTAKGDFNAKALRERVVDSTLIGDIVQHYTAFANGKKFIVFNTDVLSAEETAVEFNNQGVICSALSGQTEGGVRDAELDKFENGENTGLTNVDLFDEGFDVPAVEICIHGRPTASLAKYLQMCGRSFRVVYADGYDLTTKQGRLAAIANGPKPHAIIIDPVRNWEKHGMPDFPRIWSLADEDRTGNKTEDDTILQKVCKCCTQPYEAYLKVCPYCGATPEVPERKKPKHVDGDLLELDVEGMAALFAEREKANMSAEEFEVDMIKRRVPAVGQGRQLRAHMGAVYRRKVLHNLLGWWIGLQPVDRDLGEKYRRFYLRYGIDMSTAFTLNQQDTDALIARVARSFHHDI
jgi:superfamily II DNA or RNA helicase